MTVVHLSIATLLTSTLDVFTQVYIYTNTSDVPLKVWQNDGTVEYGKGGHLILMIVGLAALQRGRRELCTLVVITLAAAGE